MAYRESFTKLTRCWGGYFDCIRSSVPEDEWNQNRKQSGNRLKCRGQRPRLQGSDCKQCRSFYRDRLMRWQVGMIIAWAMAMAPPAFAGNDRGVSSTVSEEPPRFDFALETAYLFGAINPPARLPDQREFSNRARSLGQLSRPRGIFSRLQSGLPEFPGRADHSRDREPLLRNEPGITLQLCPAGQSNRSLFFRRTRTGSDRQSARAIRRPGTGFHFQCSKCRRLVVSVQ